MNQIPAPSSSRSYEQRFRSLFHEGRGYSSPRDNVGHVDLDALSELARTNYFLARTVIGRDFAAPAVQVCDPH